MKKSALNTLNLFQYLPKSWQFSDRNQRIIKNIFSSAMGHRAKVSAVTFSLCLYVVYKLGILSGGFTLAGLGIVFTAYKVYQNYLNKREEIKNQALRIFNQIGVPYDRHDNTPALNWIKANKEYINITLSPNGYRPIHYAIDFDFSLQVIEAIIEAGADLSSTANGFTPLLMAIESLKNYKTNKSNPENCKQIIRRLIKADANVNFEGLNPCLGSRTYTALDLLSSFPANKEFTDIIILLINSGAKISQNNRKALQDVDNPELQSLL